ncbi:MAG: nucleotidyltransferase family protein [Thermoanaerobaculia bacterium]
MNREDRIVALAARQDFLQEHRAAVEALAGGHAVRWDRLAAGAARHGVLPIVGANLRACDAAALGLPAEVATRLEVAMLENAAVRERDAARLAIGLARLREVELDALLLKGAALAFSVYREPWVVSSLDIDLCLRPGPGWQKGKGEEKEVRKALYTHGVECDLETHHDVTMNGVLPIDFPRVWREARRVRFRGVEAWVMSPEDQMIALCVGVCRKFRLKALFDVAETLRRGEALDPARLAALAREGRCEGIVYAGLLAARGVLGAEVPAGLLESLKPPRFQAARVRAVLAAGLRLASFTRGSTRPLALALTYASLRPREAWRSFLFRVRNPPRHRGEDPLAPADAVA